MEQRSSHFFWPSFVSTFAVLGISLLLFENAEAREVAWDSFKMIFAVVTTPFILETTCIIVGICVVFGVRIFQDKRDGDGWVYLATQEPDTNDLPRALTERLQSTVLTNKPEITDEALSRRSVVEGYLELGMGAQALAEFQANSPWPDDLASSLLTVRVLSASLDTDAAMETFKKALKQYVTEKPALAETAIESGHWLTNHQQDRELASLWFKEAALLQAQT
jgi:hypothetical protein